MPAGGLPAGPFKSTSIFALSCSGVEEAVAISVGGILDKQKQEKKSQYYRRFAIHEDKAAPTHFANCVP